MPNLVSVILVLYVFDMAANLDFGLQAHALLFHCDTTQTTQSYRYITSREDIYNI
jgi:hypothetical protein